MVTIHPIYIVSNNPKIEPTSCPVLYGKITAEGRFHILKVSARSGDYYEFAFSSDLRLTTNLFVIRDFQCLPLIKNSYSFGDAKFMNVTLTKWVCEIIKSQFPALFIFKHKTKSYKSYNFHRSTLSNENNLTEAIYEAVESYI